MAMRLLKGEMEEVAPQFDIEQSSEEYVANAVVCDGKEGDLAKINASMVGTMEPVLPVLMENDLVKRNNGTIEVTPLCRVMAEHFIGVDRLLEIIRLVRTMDDPIGILAELECSDRTGEKPERKKPGKR
jgi:helicase